MREITTGDVESAVSDALSIMAFVSADPPQDTMPPSGSTLLTRIDFWGDAVGSLELVCPLTFGKMLADNVLGPIEPESGVPSQDQSLRSADALRELINVTCGRMLRHTRSKLSGDVKMGVPTQKTFDLTGWDAFVHSGALVVEADGSKLAIKITQSTEKAH
jgi:hypothetical protein